MRFLRVNHKCRNLKKVSLCDHDQRVELFVSNTGRGLGSRCLVIFDGYTTISQRNGTAILARAHATFMPRYGIDGFKVVGAQRPWCENLGGSQPIRSAFKRPRTNGFGSVGLGGGGFHRQGEIISASDFGALVSKSGL